MKRFALVLLLSTVACGESQVPEEALVSAPVADAGEPDSGRASEELVLLLGGTLLRSAVIPSCAFDPADPSSFSACISPEVRVGGQPFLLELYFRRESDLWRWGAWVDSGLVEGGEPGKLAQIAHGTLSFDAEGRQVEFTQTSRFILADGTSVPFALVFRFTEVDDYNSFTAVEQR